MNINQFAVYQVKMDAEFRTLRFRPYAELQENDLRVDVNNYEQYLSQMSPDDSVLTIRKRLEEKIPKSFKGHSISVSDVIVMNKAGVVSAYYADKDKLIAIAGFLRLNSSGALVSMGQRNLRLKENTVVIYFGAKPWDGAMRLSDLYECKYEELIDLAPDYNMHLIEPARMTDEDFEKFSTSMGKVLKFMKSSADKAGCRS